MKSLSETINQINSKTSGKQKEEQPNSQNLRSLARKNYWLNGLMEIMKMEENALKKNLDWIQIFLMVSWMLNFVIAYEDKSPIMKQMGLGIAFTFKTWNIVDGSISLFFLLIFLFVSAAVEKQKIKRFSIFVANHKIKSIILCLVGTIKLIWIFIGLYFFSQLKFNETSKILMQFTITYFVGFIGGCLYFAQLSFRRNNFTGVFAEFGKVINVSDITQIQQQAEQTIKEQDKVLSETRFEKRLIFFSQDQALVIPFLMVMNLILALKDESSSMDMEIEGINLSFRTWHKIQGIMSIISIFTTQISLYAVIRIELQIKLSCQKISYCLICLHLTNSAFLTSWLVVGIVMFFRLPIDLCSEQLQQFSITYFMFILMLYALVFFSMLKDCIKYFG